MWEDLQRRASGEGACLRPASRGAEPGLLHLLAAEGRVPELDRAIKKAKSGQLMERDAEGRTPLERAACLAHDGCVEALVAAGAKAEGGGAMLGYAECDGGTPFGLRLLLRAGAERGARLEGGATPLHHYARRGLVKMVRTRAVEDIP